MKKDSLKTTQKSNSGNSNNNSNYLLLNINLRSTSMPTLDKTNIWTFRIVLGVMFCDDSHFTDK